MSLPEERAERKREVGKRLRQIARLAGKSVTDLRQELGQPGRPLGENTIYRWWRGEQTPFPEMMDRYVEVCRASGKTRAWVMAGGEEEGEVDLGQDLHLVVKEQAAALLKEVLRRTMAGTNPGLAARDLLGDRWISPARQGQYDQWEAPMREYIARHASGPWEKLTAEEREELLDAVVEMAVTRFAAFGGSD